MEGKLAKAIESIERNGNYDDFLKLATLYNTPEAQKAIAEARERFTREQREKADFHAELVKAVGSSWKHGIRIRTRYPRKLSATHRAQRHHGERQSKDRLSASRQLHH